MDCVNHTGVNATAYCQSCGKALCAACIRNAAGGQVLCEPCWSAWHSYQQPFNVPAPGTPNPTTAAVLGLIPGVGAMYNGQFIKGLIHVVIFAVLVSAAHVYDVFGIFIAAWIVYQSFEAYHTAKARRDGMPLPDPLGLNDAGSWFTPGGRPPYQGPPGAGVNPANPGQAGQGPAEAGQQIPYPVPPVPPVPPLHWRRKEPIGAIVLIGLGLLFLLGQLDLFSGRLMEFTWPLLLIGLGVWLVVRRLGESQGGQK